MIPKDWYCLCIFSGHNGLKLKLNHKKKFGRNSNMWRLKTILLRDERVNQEIKELKRFMETMKMKIQLFKIFGIHQKHSLDGNESQYKHPSKNWKELKYTT